MCDVTKAVQCEYTVDVVVRKTKSARQGDGSKVITTTGWESAVIRVKLVRLLA